MDRCLESVKHLGAGGADVSYLLSLTDVEFQIRRTIVFANDHPLVYLGAGDNEELAAILSTLKCIEGGCALLKCNQYTITTVVHVSLHGSVVEEGVAHDSLPPGGADEFTTEANQAPGRNHKLELGAAVVGILHVLHLGFAHTKLLDARSHRLLGHIQNQGFVGLRWCAINGAEDNLGLGYLEFVAFTAHRFDQDAEV